jgi:hypothetical protein
VARRDPSRRDWVCPTAIVLSGSRGTDGVDRLRSLRSGLGLDSGLASLLDRRSDEAAVSVLAPLDPGQRDEFVAAMRTVRRLARIGAIELRAVDPIDRDGRQCIRAYLAELVWRSVLGFDPGACIGVEPEKSRRPRAAHRARSARATQWRLAIRLDTNRRLVEAISMYPSAGYVEVPVLGRVLHRPLV